MKNRQGKTLYTQTVSRTAQGILIRVIHRGTNPPVFNFHFGKKKDFFKLKAYKIFTLALAVLMLTSAIHPFAVKADDASTTPSSQTATDSSNSNNDSTSSPQQNETITDALSAGNSSSEPNSEAHNVATATVTSITASSSPPDQQIATSTANSDELATSSPVSPIEASSTVENQASTTDPTISTSTPLDASSTPSNITANSIISLFDFKASSTPNSGDPQSTSMGDQENPLIATGTPAGSSTAPNLSVANAPAGPSTSAAVISPSTSTSSNPIISTTSTSSDVTLTQEIKVTNNNNATVTNSTLTNANSGNNQVTGNNGSNGQITTGDINVLANVLNVVNTNQYNSSLSQVIQNFNGLAANILMTDPAATAAQLSDALVSTICGTDVTCKSLNSYVLTNNNNAVLQNTTQVAGNSGGNTISGINNNATISSGNVNALVNVLNIANTNLFNSNWTIASINIFGNWHGDLVMPSDFYFANFVSVGNSTTTPAQALPIGSSVSLSVNNSNTANITNNVSVSAVSGGNLISSGTDASSTPETTTTPDQATGTINSALIQTGTATAAANTQTYANTNIVNSKWFLSMVNTLGNWSGNVFSLPNQVTMTQTPTGLIFFSSSNNQTFGNFLQDTAGGFGSTTTLANLNSATIQNDISVSALTGDNAISGANLNAPTVLTGNARALANILNFANTNLVNSNLQLGLVNILGNWQGNVVFGYPDLAVTQTLSGGQIPSAADTEVTFKIDYSNIGQSVMDSSELEWDFDPSALTVDSVSIPASQAAAGTLKFSLGKLGLQSSGSITITAHTLQTLPAGREVDTLAKVWGSGPESDTSNNQYLLQSFVTAAGIDLSSYSRGNGDVRVYKYNSTGGRPVQPGGSVGFTLVIDNDGTGPVHNLVVTDEMRGPGDTVVMSKKFNIVDMDIGEELTIDYNVQIPEDAKPGNYTNTAVANFTTSSNITQDSLNIASTSFAMAELAGSNIAAADTTTTPSGLAMPMATTSTTTITNIKMQRLARKFSGLASGEIAGASTTASSSVTGQLKGQDADYQSSRVPNPLWWELLLALTIAIGYASYSSWERTRHRE